MGSSKVKPDTIRMFYEVPVSKKTFDASGNRGIKHKRAVAFSNKAVSCDTAYTVVLFGTLGVRGLGVLRRCPRLVDFGMLILRGVFG